jgi:hypothetical protein
MTLLVLFLALSLIGAIDVGYYHIWKLGLYGRAEARREQLAHLTRGALFIGMLALVVAGRPQGACAAALLALFACDTINTFVDVVLEKGSRARLGGISRGEYLVHIAGTLLAGAAFAVTAIEAPAALARPTGFAPYPGSAAEGARALAALALAAAGIGFVVELTLHARARARTRVRARARAARDAERARPPGRA